MPSAQAIARSTDRLGGLEGAAAGEDGQAAKEGLLVRREECRDSRRSRSAWFDGGPVHHVVRRSTAVIVAPGEAGALPEGAGETWPRRAQSRGATRRAEGIWPQRPRIGRCQGEAGSTSRARSTKSRTAATSARCSDRRRRSGSGTTSGGTGTSCSPSRRSGVRLVTSTTSRGHRTRRCVTNGAASGRCSKLSSTSRRCRDRKASVTPVSGDRAKSSPRLRARATAGAT